MTSSIGGPRGHRFFHRLLRIEGRAQQPRRHPRPSRRSRGPRQRGRSRLHRRRLAARRARRGLRSGAGHVRRAIPHRTGVAVRRRGCRHRGPRHRERPGDRAHNAGRGRRPPPHLVRDRVISLAAGRVLPQRSAGTVVARNIPYAAAGRFEAPLPHARWDGVRDGRIRGPVSPQLSSRLDGVTGGRREPRGPDRLAQG